MLILDSDGAILAEYARHLSRSGQPGFGDAFYKWVFDQQANRNRVRRVTITPDPQRGYAEFPDDPALAAFDHDDRKFVAVAIKHSSKRPPPIVNATDTDWKTHQAALARHRISIEFVCPELMSTASTT